MHGILYDSGTGTALCCLSECLLTAQTVCVPTGQLLQPTLQYCVAANSSARQPALTLSVLSVDFN